MLALGWLASSLHAREPNVLVISPHNEAIRKEFGRGFSEWHQRMFGEHARVEWRDQGGTDSCLRFVLSEFASKPNGIGLDVFFGGGLEPYLILSDKHFAASHRPSADILKGLPPDLNGIELYDPGFQWFSAAVSSFGILQNRRVQKLTGLPLVDHWEDLANPRLLDWVGASDPRRSGTMAVMFEAFLQAFGWDKGWQVLTRMGGNTRQFDVFSSATAKEVTLGQIAYGLAIDFYAFTQVAATGPANLAFVLPRDFTSITPDGIAVLKGAPNLVTAKRFLDFVLSEDGQRLWFLPKGHAQGPRDYSIERMSVRPDFYRTYRGVSNIEFSPFDLPQKFHYNTKLGRDRREVLTMLVGVLLVDTHSELRAAWKAVIKRGLKPPDLDGLGRMPVTEAEALKLSVELGKNAVLRNQKKIEWQTWAQQKYRRLQ